MALIDTVIDFCDKQYRDSICNTCNHINGCPNIFCKTNCKICLEQVHSISKDRYSDYKKIYDCDRMIYFYVCDFIRKYASEMWSLIKDSAVINKINDYNILSIGCGGCPDLMAFESYFDDMNLKNKTLNYFGIDKNKKWEPIHSLILNYLDQSPFYIKADYKYDDFINNDAYPRNVNVIILQYLISALYDRHGNNENLNRLFNKIINKIILKTNNRPIVILINDVNNVDMGRNYFDKLSVMIRMKYKSAKISRYFFKSMLFHNDQNDYGKARTWISPLYDKNVFPTTPYKIDYEHLYEPNNWCSSAQMLIEIY